MIEHARAAGSKYGLFRSGGDGVDALTELALDLRSSWHHGADMLWRRLDPELWERTQNPWVVLQTVSEDTLQRHLADTTFRMRVSELIQTKREAAEAPAWFQQNYPQSLLSGVAYFSMEFMLSEALPIYSGGLGNVAGDQLKAANDLGVPVTGVGLLYQQGYFRQMISPSGVQEAVYPYNDPGQLPITPLRRPDSEWLRLKLELPGHEIWIRAWQARVGRLNLYLLDTNDAGNYPPFRGITSELYGGGRELRLLQEMVLGIGGWRLLTALGIDPEVCHLNEGHAALVVLERARSFMVKAGVSFEIALNATRPGNLFTTHTAVPAGFDRFANNQVEHWLGTYAETQLDISRSELVALGRERPDDATEEFNMAFLAIRGSGAVNGVSRLHGQVSRRLFAPLFPGWPEDDVPIGHITNGVHTPTWDSAPADALWTNTCGKDRWLGTTESLGRDICCLSDAQLWAFRSTASAMFVEYVRERFMRQLVASGAIAEDAGIDTDVLDPKALTVGFARRFATYKRPELLLHDTARLLRLLNSSERPMQIVIAGKAHPADAAGQALIRRWVEFAQHSDARNHVVFLSDYDMHLAEHLVQGVDVWLNTPRRPWEASGTSGMKVLVNGGINISELDGWWAEAYKPEVGWALGDGEEHGDDPTWDVVEAEALYELLEREVVPEFYDRDEHGIPRAWVSKMRNSMAELTPHFSTNRTVREYVEQYYLPAADAYHARTANTGAFSAEITDWRRTLDQKWAELRFGGVEIETLNSQHYFEVEAYLGELGPDDVQVELYAEAAGGEEPVREPMIRKSHAGGRKGCYVYAVAVPAVRSANDFTARLLPSFPGVSVPLEAPHVLWQR